jgi:riboflavin synthase
VSGHVDCVGTVVGRGEDSGSIRLQVGLPAEYRRYAARKGSICVDGVSLTINEVSGNIITVNIIPHTAKATIAGSYDVGSAVNIEVDQLARYLESLLDARDEMRAPDASASGVTKELLRAHGYA